MSGALIRCALYFMFRNVGITEGRLADLKAGKLGVEAFLTTGRFGKLTGAVAGMANRGKL